ncbi:MAG: hypothetical protein CR997_13200 [Acidobacteria bacterium]|nr:MAG: hypothetical protein CR997_13200 [Acidobacteriota bacterium]
MNIVLLAPLALLGMIGLAVPIYLHMRHRPRAISFRFSALEFLLSAQKKRQRHLKVEQFLLLLTRLILLSLLVFLFSRPFRESGTGTLPSQGPVFFILDDSASMMAGRQGSSAFQKAITAMGDMASEAQADAQAFLLCPSDPASHRDIRTFHQLKKILPALKPSTHNKSLDDCYNRALDFILSEKYPSATVEIFSDNRLSSWKAPPKEPASHIQVHINQLDVAKENIGLVDLKPLVASTQSNGFEVQVLNSSPSDTPIELKLEAKHKTWRENLPLAPHATTAHRFNLTETSGNRLTFSLPADSFPLDNCQIFPVKTYRKPNILLVDGNPDPNPENSASYFFRTVLDGLEPLQGVSPYQLVTAAGMTKERMSWADVIMMLNVDDPPINLCSKALSSGKGLFVSCGNRILPKAWNAFMQNYGMEFWEWTDLPNPFHLTLRENRILDAVNPENFSTYFAEAAVDKNQIVTLKTSKMKPVLALEDGSPVLLAGQVGQGRLMLWTSSMDLSGANLPLQVGYVPLIQSIIDYLFFREEQIELELKTVSELEDVLLNGKLVLTQNWTDLNPDQVNGPLPGLYVLTQPDGSSRNLAVRLDQEESDFRTRNSEDNQNSFLPASFQEQVRSDLGMPLAWLLFIAIVIETALAARITQKWGNR